MYGIRRLLFEPNIRGITLITASLMANVSFNEEPIAVGYSPASKKPFLIGLVLSTKIVSTDRQAQYVLIGIAALCVLLTIFFWPKGRPAANPSEVPAVAGPTDGRLLNR